MRRLRRATTTARPSRRGFGQRRGSPRQRDRHRRPAEQRQPHPPGCPQRAADSRVAADEPFVSARDDSAVEKHRRARQPRPTPRPATADATRKLRRRPLLRWWSPPSQPADPTTTNADNVNDMTGSSSSSLSWRNTRQDTPPSRCVFRSLSVIVADLPTAGPRTCPAAYSPCPRPTNTTGSPAAAASVQIRSSSAVFAAGPVPNLAAGAGPACNICIRRLSTAHLPSGLAAVTVRRCARCARSRRLAALRRVSAETRRKHYGAAPGRRERCRLSRRSLCRPMAAPRRLAL